MIEATHYRLFITFADQLHPVFYGGDSAFDLQ